MLNLETFYVNGIKVLFHQNKSFLTSVQILTNVGSSAEDPSIYGLAHILEHMFFKGSTKRPGGKAISRAANDIGGKMNAYTTYDHTVYYITILNDKFEEGFDILADMYQNPIFPAEEFAKELNPILSEFREREDDPDSFLVERALQKYLGDAYHPIIGTKETIQTATVEKMHAFKNRFYGGSNVMISIVGGIDRATAERVVANHFPAHHEKEKPVLKQCSFQTGEIHLKKPGIQEAYYTLFFPALPSRHPDRYKQDMMNYLLGGNDSALLFERVREELGMSCYGIYSWIMRHDSHNIMAISCGIDQKELNQLHQEVEDQIKRICDSPLEEERLLRGKASLRTSIAAKSETSNGLNGMIGVPVLKGELENPVEKALRHIESITTEDVMNFARTTLSGPSFKAILLPEGS